MPADRTPAVLIADPRTELGHAIAIQFMLGGWFVIGCDEGTYPGRQTKAHITANTTSPDECERAVAKAVQLGNGLDFVVDLDPASLLGDAAMPAVSALGGRVVRDSDVQMGSTADETAERIFALAPHELDAVH